MLIEICFQFFILIAKLISIHSKHHPDHVNLGGIFQSLVGSDIHGGLDSQYISAISLALDELNNKNHKRSDIILFNTTLQFAIRFPTVGYSSIFESSKYLMSKAFSSNGIDIALGPTSMATTKVSAQIFGMRNIIQLGWNTDSSFSYKKNYPNFFRISHSDAFQGRMLAEIISSDLFGWKKVTLFSSSDYFGSSAAYEFRTRSYDLGIELLADISFTKGTTNFEAGITRAKDSLASIFVILADTTDSIRLLQQGYSSGLFSDGKQIIGTSYLAVEESWRQMESFSNVNELMKGVIIVIPSIDLTNDKIIQFMKRWKAQKNTISYLPNGQISCSNKTDDDFGNYLFQNFNGTNWECSGLDYQSFPLNGSTMNNMTFFVYDAVYSIAYALHELLYVQGQATIDGEKLKQVLYNQSFQGLTGNISYYSGHTNNENYGGGDRRTGAYYRLSNFHGCSDYSNEFTSSCFKTIGSWHSENGYKTCLDSGFEASECSFKIYYNTKKNQIPIDWPEPIYRHLSGYLYGIVWSCVAICATLVAVFSVMTIKYRKFATIKAAQPAMLYVILVGTVLATCFVAITAREVTLSNCITGLWLGHLSYGLVFGALYLKTWRVHRLANSGFKRVIFSARYLNMALLSLFLSLVVYLLIMTLVSGIYVHEHHTLNGNITYVDMQCSKKINGLAVLLYLLEGILLVAGAYLCWLVRNVPDNINESVYIASAIYVIGFVCLLVFPATFVLDGISPISSSFAKVIGFSLCLVSTVISIFGSKAVMLIKLDHAMALGDDAIPSGSRELLKSHSHSGVNISQQIRPSPLSKDQNGGSKVKILLNKAPTLTEQVEKSGWSILHGRLDEEGELDDQNGVDNELVKTQTSFGTLSSSVNMNSAGFAGKSPHLKPIPGKYCSTIAKSTDETDDPLGNRILVHSHSSHSEELGLTETRALLFRRQLSQENKLNVSSLGIIAEDEFVTPLLRKGQSPSPSPPDESNTPPHFPNNNDFEIGNGIYTQNLSSLNSSVNSVTSDISERNDIKVMQAVEVNNILEQFSSPEPKVFARGSSRNNLDGSYHNEFKPPVRQGSRLSGVNNKMFVPLDQLSLASELKGDVDNDDVDSEEEEDDDDEDMNHRLFRPLSKGTLHLSNNSPNKMKLKGSVGEATKSRNEKKTTTTTTTNNALMMNSLEVLDCDNEDFV